jgi:hypothetical protein
MMSKGFITTADFQKNENSEIEITELQVRDLEIGAPNDEDAAIELFVAQNGCQITFTLPEANALVEAFQEIIGRYKGALD